MSDSFHETAPLLACHVLLDWSDVLCLDSVAICLGWHAMLVSVPIAGFLAASTSGPTPSIADLRADFRAQIRAEVDARHDARMRKRYPPLLAL